MITSKIKSILRERIDNGFEKGSDSDTNYDSLSHNDLAMNKVRFCVLCA